MRDNGFDFYWHDLYTENLFAKCFEGDINEQYSAVTSFESFEHFLDPIYEINKLVKISKTIIFSTELLPNPIPNPNDWWYYGTSHGQHISFYSKQTLQKISEMQNLKYISFSGFHIFCEKDIFLYLCKLQKKLNIKYIKNIFENNIRKKIRNNMKSKTFSDHLKVIESKMKTN